MKSGSKMVGWVLTIAVFALLSRAAMAKGGGATVDEAQAFADRDVTVLVFLYTDCPIANKMAPELGRLHETYGKKGVAFYRIYADASLSDADIAQHGKEYKLSFPSVQDADLELVKLTGAQVTPEAVVYDRSGTRRYRGRINNRYEDLGRYRQEPTEHDLRDALDALLAGKEVVRPETKAVGCYLPTVKHDDEETKNEESHEEATQP